MSKDFGYASDTMRVGALVPLADRGVGTTDWLVRKFDTDATAWVSRRLGGEVPGHPGFVQPDLADFLLHGVRPYAEDLVRGNLITNAGWGRLLTLGIAGGGTAYAASSTRIGAGNGTGTAAGNATDLTAAAGSGNRWFQLVSGAGTVTNGTGTSGTGSATLAFSATFGTGDGNFAWNEFGIDQGTGSSATVTATLLNLKTSIAQGTKASGQTWTATATLSFTST
jgi:hypothetical protein